MALFHTPKNEIESVEDFGYLDSNTLYFDSACQTLRPKQVVDAVNEYYFEYNACGERVKYEWGEKVDEKIEATRQSLLKLSNKSPRDYVCAFTLNTTYGINLLLSQLQPKTYKKIVTSEAEHNSVFLPTIIWAKKYGLTRLVLPRTDGRLLYKPEDLDKALVVVNTTSNVDGSNLRNAAQLADDVHAAGGITIFDGAQTMGHIAKNVKDIDFDALCFSGHKMYAPSLGVIIIKKSLLESLELSFIGGGTVQDVQLDSYTLLMNEPASRLEPGLQNFSGIIGLGASVRWYEHYRPEGREPMKHEEILASKLFNGLKNIPSLHLFNSAPSPIISFYSSKIDSHKLAIYLSAQSIMARSGYFCCSYWLDAQRHLPPLLRISLGLNNTEAQVERLLQALRTVVESR